ncbi:hypothetical protein K474DRAFT_1669931 [Panus rudis PR-1116 ss-1]|nr:hypothetical protein K474DRAFT_1669931 [Panus rudis PR-1116 ss-1]
MVEDPPVLAEPLARDNGEEDKGTQSSKEDKYDYNGEGDDWEAERGDGSEFEDGSNDEEEDGSGEEEGADGSNGEEAVGGIDDGDDDLATL